VCASDGLAARAGGGCWHLRQGSRHSAAAPTPTPWAPLRTDSTGSCRRHGYSSPAGCGRATQAASCQARCSRQPTNSPPRSSTHLVVRLCGVEVAQRLQLRCQRCIAPPLLLGHLQRAERPAAPAPTLSGLASSKPGSGGHGAAVGTMHPPRGKRRTFVMKASAAAFWASSWYMMMLRYCGPSSLPCLQAAAGTQA